MKHTITAAILALLASAFVWQAFAQTDCEAACKAKYDACMKQIADPDKNVPGVMLCRLDYIKCLEGCK